MRLWETPGILGGDAEKARQSREFASRLEARCVQQGIEVDPDSLEVELIFILSRDDSRAQQLRQGYPIDPNHSSVLRRLEKGSFYRFRLVEGSAAAP